MPKYKVTVAIELPDIEATSKLEAIVAVKDLLPLDLVEKVVDVMAKEIEEKKEEEEKPEETPSE